MTTTINNTNKAPMTIKVEQLVNGFYVTFAEQKINACKNLCLDFITQNTNPVRASFIQTGTGFEVEELSYAHLNEVAYADLVCICKNIFPTSICDGRANESKIRFYDIKAVFQAYQRFNLQKDLKTGSGDKSKLNLNTKTKATFVVGGT